MKNADKIKSRLHELRPDAFDALGKAPTMADHAEAIWLNRALSGAFDNLTLKQVLSKINGPLALCASGSNFGAHLDHRVVLRIVKTILWLFDQEELAKSIEGKTVKEVQTIITTNGL